MIHFLTILSQILKYFHMWWLEFYEHCRKINQISQFNCWRLRRLCVQSFWTDSALVVVVVSLPLEVAILPLHDDKRGEYIFFWWLVKDSFIFDVLWLVVLVYSNMRDLNRLYWVHQKQEHPKPHMIFLHIEDNSYNWFEQDSTGIASICILLFYCTTRTLTLSMWEQLTWKAIMPTKII